MTVTGKCTESVPVRRRAGIGGTRDQATYFSRAGEHRRSDLPRRKYRGDRDDEERARVQISWCSSAERVAAREEERRRLHRDLHDGLGPQLASLTLTVAAARELLRHDVDAADALLQELAAHTQAAVADVRRMARQPSRW
jgi:signal transduction histidine kinase